MSTAAPIKGDQSVRDQFTKADTDPNFGYLNIRINLDTNQFEVGTYGSKDGNDEDVFKALLTHCKEKEHTYFIIRDPTQSKQPLLSEQSEEAKESGSGKANNAHNLYILIHYAPDLSPVKQRMMYASSRPSLKNFLGSSAFSEDYHCSSKDELQLSKIVDARTLHHKIDFRSDAEIEKEQAAYESVATSAASQVMRSLPIDIQESAKSAISNYASDACKCVFLSLTSKKQNVEGEEQSESDINGIRALLTETEPKYILFWYSKSKQDNSNEEKAKEQSGEKRIFGYYCPDKAEKRLRFAYSTCKTNVMEYCRGIGLEFYNKLQFSSPADLNPEFLDYHIFPTVEKKETFGKPKGPKTRRKGKTKSRKKLNLDDL